VAVCQVENPYPGANDTPWKRAYAVVVKQFNDAYPGHPVAGLVTVYDHRDVVAPHFEDLSSWVKAQKLTIHNVYRDKHFKSLNRQMERPAVQFGKFLFEHECFKEHAAERTDEGDAWARSVGGRVPEREEVGDPGLIRQHSRAALQKLQDDPWWVAINSNEYES
jgi:hypothetical protein